MEPLVVKPQSPIEGIDPDRAVSRPSGSVGDMDYPLIPLT